MNDPLHLLDVYYPLPDDAREALMTCTRLRTYGKLETVQEIGSTCRTVYLMKGGIARIFYLKEDQDITEHFAFAGDLVVRAESLFTGQPTRKGIETLEPSNIFAIDALSLIELYDAFPAIERLFRIIYQWEYVRAVRRLESIQFQSATERYRELLQTTNLVNQIPLKHVASYLGITQVSLSRIRASLKDSPG